ncbi:hypothetical protein HALLA_14630 [Halostagnicola larsenii XH-48]|uniref:Uncharacterized protein n=1 Tax=Halostagnicola larsenii XH-48 TaxID=797299 RepID=W0JQP7_9EURY|nr:hypothetical protein HALLA_14630 [Halostagnicola larsenii XH-48]
MTDSDSRLFGYGLVRGWKTDRRIEHSTSSTV